MLTLNKTQKWPATSRRGMGRAVGPGKLAGVGVSSQCPGPNGDTGNTDDRLGLSAGVAGKDVEVFCNEEGKEQAELTSS